MSNLYNTKMTWRDYACALREALPDNELVDLAAIDDEIRDEYEALLPWELSLKEESDNDDDINEDVESYEEDLDDL